MGHSVFYDWVYMCDRNGNLYIRIVMGEINEWNIKINGLHLIEHTEHLIASSFQIECTQNNNTTKVIYSQNARPSTVSWLP